MFFIVLLCLYGMFECSDWFDFYICDQVLCQVIIELYWYVYFQIQFNFGGDIEQCIGGVMWLFLCGVFVFVLLYCEYLILYLEGVYFIVINFSQVFLCVDFDVDLFDFEDVFVYCFFELMLFCFQEYFDFILIGDMYDEVCCFVLCMFDVDCVCIFGLIMLLCGYLL